MALKIGNIGTFIGDDDEESYARMYKIASQIATDYQISVQEVFSNEAIPPEQAKSFLQDISEMYDYFSGTSILEQCIEGHRHIEELLQPIKQSPANPGLV